MAATRAWQKAHPDRRLAIERKRWLKKYGLTLEQYERMLASQGGGCAVCGGPPNGRGAFHVDHDHESGTVRGLLCHKCNTALGLVDESLERLEKLSTYLARIR